MNADAPIPALFASLWLVRFILGKANTRVDALSADLAKKNKLVDKVTELQRTTSEVRVKTWWSTLSRHVRVAVRMHPGRVSPCLSPTAAQLVLYMKVVHLGDSEGHLVRFI